MQKFVLALLCLMTIPFAHAEEEELSLEEDAAYGYEEQIIEKPGKKVRRVREGKMRPRKGDPTVGEIYSDDVARLETRIRSRRFYSFAFGPHGMAQSSGQILYGGTIARHWEAARRAEIRLRVSGAGGPGGSFAQAGLGAAFIPFVSDFSPVIGADFGGGLSSPKEGSARGGMGAGAFLGLRMFRTADTQLELLASYNAIFAEEAAGSYGIQLGFLF